MMARILNLIGIGKATLVDDSGEVAKIQVTEGARGSGGSDRVTDNVPRVGEYGFASALPANSEVLVIRRNGDRGNGIVIATQHRASRPTNMPVGDVWLYDLRGRAVKLTVDGIELDAAGGEVLVTNAAKVRCACDIETTGDVVARADGSKVSLTALHDAYNMHKHPPAAGGGTWGSGPPVPLAGGSTG